MPATSLIIYERSDRLAKLVESCVCRLPAQVRRARSPQEFAKWLAASVRSIAIIDVHAVPDSLWELLIEARSADAATVVVGAIATLDVVMAARELEVTCLLPVSPPARQWQILLTRLIEQSQQRMARTG